MVLFCTTEIYWIVYIYIDRERDGGIYIYRIYL